MSAHIVSDNHINTMTSTARALLGPDVFSVYFENQRHLFDLRNNEEAQKLGQILLNENYRSVNTRYPNDVAAPHELEFFRVAPVSHLGLLKAIDYYLYQTNETDDFESTLAYKVCHEMRLRTIRKMDGYDKLPWGFD